MTRAIGLALVLAAVAQVDARQGAWFAAEARSIRVLSDQSAAAASSALNEIESAESLLRSVVGVTLTHPVRAFAVKDANSLREIAPQFWERRGIRPRALAYAAPYTSFIAVREDLSADARREALRHEYVHLLTAEHVPDPPAWLNEGLSEFWGSLVVEGDRVIVGRPNTRHLARLQPWQPLQRTLRRQRGEFIADSEPAEVFYAQSWATVHYLLLGRDASAPLTFAPPDYLSPPPDLETRVRDYVKEGKLREVSVPFSPPSLSPSAPAFVPESRSLAERAHMLVFGPRPDAAIAMARRALELEPRESLALDVMGTYYFLHNKPDQAREWLAKAFDTQRSAPLTAIYLALLAGSNADRERYLAAAVNAQPDLEVAWLRLFEIYRQDGRLQQLQRWCSRSVWRRIVLSPLSNMATCG